MGYFQVRYNSRVVIYDRRGFIRLATGLICVESFDELVGVVKAIFSTSQFREIFAKAIEIKVLVEK